MVFAVVPVLMLFPVVTAVRSSATPTINNATINYEVYRLERADFMWEWTRDMLRHAAEIEKTSEDTKKWKNAIHKLIAFVKTTIQKANVLKSHTLKSKHEKINGKLHTLEDVRSKQMLKISAMKTTMTSKSRTFSAMTMENHSLNNNNGEMQHSLTSLNKLRSKGRYLISTIKRETNSADSAIQGLKSDEVAQKNSNEEVGKRFKFVQEIGYDDLNKLFAMEERITSMDSTLSTLAPKSLIESVKRRNEAWKQELENVTKIRAKYHDQVAAEKKMMASTDAIINSLKSDKQSLEDRLEVMRQKVQTLKEHNILPICERGMKYKGGAFSVDKESHLVRATLKNNPTIQSEILCDTYTEEGGWLVFQRRDFKNSSGVHENSFSRCFDGYTDGFGSIYNHFWWGNENLHRFTLNGEYEMFIVIKFSDYPPLYYYQKYKHFKIGSRATKYKLTYSSREVFGPYIADSLARSNGKPFGTLCDGDPVAARDRECARHMGGGWWFDPNYAMKGYYQSCFGGMLNGCVDKLQILWTWVDFEIRVGSLSQMMVRQM